MTLMVTSGKGHLLTARGSVLAFKAVAAQTGGDFSLMERTLPLGRRTPPAHRHTNCSEAFFVLDGPITFWLDGERARRSAIGYGHAPAFLPRRDSAPGAAAPPTQLHLRQLGKPV
jgi:hypothetical protein